MSFELLETFREVERFHWWWEGRRALIKQLIGSTTPEKILDVGSGTGITIEYLQNTYPDAKIYGVDLAPNAIKIARGFGLKNIKQADATKLPFPDSSFDLVLLLDVLEHIKDDQKAIQEAKRLLSPGGRLIITAPALPFIWSAHDINQGHHRRYTRRRLRLLAGRVGLKVTFLSYFNFFLSLPIVIIRLLGNLPFLKRLNNYNSAFNYNISHKRLANSILTKLFVGEIKLSRFVRYPFGISVAAVFQK